MPENKFNDNNLSKLTGENEVNNKSGLSQIDNSKFTEFFGSKKAKTTYNSSESGSSPESFQSAGEKDGKSERGVSNKPPRKTGLFSGFMYFVFIVSVSIILACVLWIAASDVLALNKAEVSAEIVLPQEIFTKETRTIEKEDGSTGTVTYNKADMGKVASILKKAGIIEYKSLFMLYSAVSNANEKLDPGTYELSTIYDYRAIVKKMHFGSGAMVTTDITFPEGMTLKEVFELLQEKKVCTVDELNECAATMDFGYSFLEDLPYDNASRLEGYLFPDTYQFYEGSNAQTAIDTFLQIFKARVSTDLREKAEATGYSLHEIIIIASMIEKEAGSDSERATIASVIFNRLKQNMPLQIDATVQYALPERKEQLSVEDTQIDSPYNTYKYTGLPAGPIANPGLASIKAAISPAKTSYLYYALDEATGTHKFFTNYSEFEAFKSTQSYG